MRAIRVVSSLLASALFASLATAAAAAAQAPAAQPAPPAAAAAPKAPEPPADGKQVVAAIPFQPAAFQTEEGKRLLAELKKKYDPKQQTLKALAEEVGTLDKQLKDPASKLTDAEKATHQKTLEAKRKQLQRDAAVFQQESEKDFNAVWRPLAEKFYQSMVAEAKERGVTMIVDAASEQHPVIWAAETARPMDLTEGSVTRFNSTPAAAPAPVAPTAPAAPAAGAATK